MKFDIKSKKGFTLIELLVVIGILAVLAAIAIPSIAGLIDRANVSADSNNATEYTNAMERFVSEYEMYCQDVQSGKVDINNMSAAQSRVYNVIKTTEFADIRKIETGGNNGISVNRTTKYPTNKSTVVSVIENYAKTSSSTFDPKQSDVHFYYNPTSGKVIFNIETSNYELHNAKLMNGTDGNGNILNYDTEWIDLTTELKTIHTYNTVSKLSDSKLHYEFFIPETKCNFDTGVVSIFYDGEYKPIKSMKVLSKNLQLLNGAELTLETGNTVITFTPNKDNISPLEGTNLPNGISGTRNSFFKFSANLTYKETQKDTMGVKRVCIETVDGTIIYSQPFLVIFNEVK